MHFIFYYCRFSSQNLHKVRDDLGNLFTNILKIFLKSLTCTVLALTHLFYTETLIRKVDTTDKGNQNAANTSLLNLNSKYT